MARIRLVSPEHGGSLVSLIIDDKTEATWGPLDASDALGLHNNIKLVTEMLQEAYEKGRAAQKVNTSKILRDIFGLKEGN